MARYLVQWRYYSSLCERYGLGRLDPGTYIDVDPSVAEAINGDSPGVLGLPVVPPEERAAQPALNRMARGGANRGPGRPRKAAEA